MEKDDFLMRDQVIKEIFSMVKKTEKENSVILMDQPMKESLRMIN